MKPSPAAPWTLEDAMVWRRFELTIGDLAVWRYVHQDRRDAELMLIAAQISLGYVCRSTDPTAPNFTVWVRAPRGARTMFYGIAAL